MPRLRAGITLLFAFVLLGGAVSLAQRGFEGAGAGIRLNAVFAFDQQMVLRGSGTFDADNVSPTSEETFLTRGRYEDQYVKEEGRWFFKERRIIIFYSFQVANPSVSKHA